MTLILSNFLQRALGRHITVGFKALIDDNPPAKAA